MFTVYAFADISLSGANILLSCPKVLLLRPSPALKYKTIISLSPSLHNLTSIGFPFAVTYFSIFSPVIWNISFVTKLPSTYSIFLVLFSKFQTIFVNFIKLQSLLQQSAYFIFVLPPLHLYKILRLFCFVFWFVFQITRKINWTMLYLKFYFLLHNLPDF